MSSLVKQLKASGLASQEAYPRYFPTVPTGMVDVTVGGDATQESDAASSISRGWSSTVSDTDGERFTAFTGSAGPVPLLEKLIASGVTPTAACELVTGCLRYCSLPLAGGEEVVSESVASSGSTRSVRRRMRRARLRQEGEELAAADGMCYLRVIKWDKRLGLSQRLGRNPTVASILSALQCGDLDLQLAKANHVVCVSRAIGAQAYHVVPGVGADDSIGSVLDVFSRLVIAYPTCTRAGFKLNSSTSAELIPIIATLGGFFGKSRKEPVVRHGDVERLEWETVKGYPKCVAFERKLGDRACTWATFATVQSVRAHQLCCFRVPGNTSTAKLHASSGMEMDVPVKNGYYDLKVGQQYVFRSRQSLTSFVPTFIFPVAISLGCTSVDDVDRREVSGQDLESAAYQNLCDFDRNGMSNVKLYKAGVNLHVGSSAQNVLSGVPGYCYVKLLDSQRFGAVVDRLGPYPRLRDVLQLRCVDLCGLDVMRRHCLTFRGNCLHVSRVVSRDSKLNGWHDLGMTVGYATDSLAGMVMASGGSNGGGVPDSYIVGGGNTFSVVLAILTCGLSILFGRCLVRRIDGVIN